MRKKIDVFDYTKEIMKALQSGILLTTKTEEKINSMTISWGFLGIEWGKPTFVTVVRENRFTKSQLDKNPEFTINIPVGEFDKTILSTCGIKSGHTTDKIKELSLTLEEPEIISVPAIRELPLTLECKVVYKQKQTAEAFSEEYIDQFYPQNIDSHFHGANKDFHTAYYGEIVSSYIL